MSLALPALALLGAALISVGSVAGTGCNKFEVYKPCGPIADLTCDTCSRPVPYNFGHGVKCPSGCFCQEGYVRDAQRNCIPRTSCPKDCPANSAFSPNGGYQSTCTKPRAVASTHPGCYCNPGYVLDTASNSCIRWQACPCLGKNQVYSDCVPEFPRTCNHRSRSSKHDICLPDWKGCICKPGHVLNADNVCIPTISCPSTPCEVKCAKRGNEKYVACVSDRYCNMTFVPVPIVCKHGCQCDPGYARDASGKCIPLNKCPCPNNATFALGVSACPRTCSTRHLPVHCLGIKEAGCACNPGYVLNSKGQCILEKDCDPTCPPGQEWTVSGTQHFCFQRDPKLIKNGCICSKGLLFDEVVNTCVTKDKCTPPTLDAICKVKDPRKQHRCQSLSCLATCDKQKPSACSPSCVDGCYCTPPFVQVSLTNTTCVAPSQCPTPPVIKECPATMRPTAEGRLYYCGNKPSEYKKNDCVCAPGYQYDENTSRCVKPEDCTCAKTVHNCCKGQPNKEYATCKTKRCAPTCESQYPKRCMKECSDGCVCKEGFIQVSDTDTRCVLPSQCPKPICGPHSHLSDKCVTSRRCDNMYLNITQARCDRVPRCVCDDGYVLNSKLECVKEAQCKTDEIKCAQNMEYSMCHGCPRYCDNLHPICTLQCRQGCACKQGYVLNGANGCVLEKDCPLKCPPNEEYKRCKSMTPDTCAHAVGQPKRCLYQEHCVAGCECKSGYLRNNKGICVKPSECHECGPNMHYTGITDTTGYCKSSVKPVFLLPNGCKCNPGLVFDGATGKCVDASMCTEAQLNTDCQRKDPNSIFSPCPCDATCFVRNPMCSSICHAGCRCKPGYVRSGSKCILETTCPIIDPIPCRGNTTMRDCVFNDLCATIKCQAPAPKPCMSGCGCSNGYLENSKGQCVLPKDCDNHADCAKYPNSEFSSCGGCQRTCKNRTPICDKRCHVGCFCKKGYVWDEQREECIPEEKCPKVDPTTAKPPVCPVNSSATKCVKPCPARCPSRFKELIACPMNYPCKEGCFCNEGYVLNGVGHCVKPSDCPPIEPVCKNNLQYSAQPAVLETCESYFNQPTKAANTTHCICPAGLVYDKTKELCVAPSACPNAIPCGPNMVYRFVNTCRRTCDTYNDTRRILCPMPFRKGCDCMNGYVLNKQGKCVLPKDCPHDTSNCPYGTVKAHSNRPRTCEDLHATKLDDRDGCFCNSPLVYHSEKKACVYQAECPKPTEKPKCPPNSTPTKCVKPCPARCPCQFRELLKCPIDYPCVPGCQCNEGFVLNNAGDCVKPSQCPPKEPLCKNNLQYSSPPAPLHTCESYYQQTLKPNSSLCICATGLVYDKTKQTCVVPSACPNATHCGPNMVYRIVNTCGRSCDTYKDAKLILCQKATKKGCDCIDGYVLNKQGKCVLPKDCPHDTSNCPYGTVKAHSNRPRTCEDLHATKLDVRDGCFCNSPLVYHSEKKVCVYQAECPKPTEKPLKCPPNSTPTKCVKPCPARCPCKFQELLRCPTDHPCVPGCQCNEGFVLNHAGNCVKPSECPPKEPLCKNNLQYSSPPAPLHTCESYYQQAIMPKSSLCICPTGLVYDKTKQACIVPSACPNAIHCGPNMVYRIVNTCHRTCDTFNTTKAMMCPRPAIKGCDCVDGYVLNKEGKCVLPKDCPHDTSNCPYGTVKAHSNRPRTCEDLHATKLDDRDGCFCNSPLVYHSEKKVCVYQAECPKPTEKPLKCPPNSTLTKCVKPCPARCPCKFQELLRCPTDHPCVPGCQCNEGFVLNRAGNCVKPSECPPKEPLCKNNLQYSSPPAPLQTCESYYHQTTVVNSSLCICPTGLVYDKTKQACVAPSACPNAIHCGPNMKYRKVNTCYRTCDTYNTIKNKLCPLPVKYGCDCVDGYVLTKDGRCVLPKECPAGECKCPFGTEEANSNRPRTCEDLSSSNLAFRDACFCSSPLVYDSEKKKCVYPADCPKQPPMNCEPNATYTNPVYTCGRTCSTYYIAHLIKCAAPPPTPGCQCNTGFVQNKQKQCIRIEDCSESEVSCPGNMHYEQCYRPRTCEHLLTNSKTYHAGCFCEKSMVFDDATKQCVAPESCPLYKECRKCQQSDPHSVFDQCASSTDITCENPNGPATDDCRERCVCQKGYIYKSKHELVCIRADQCESTTTCTKANTIYKKLCSAEPTCSQKNPTIDPYKCIKGCFCKDGYVLNIYGHCIPQETCPGVICRKNETYSDCANACHKTCETQFLDIAFKCACQPGCECSLGYMDNGHGSCILPKDCDPKAIKCPPKKHYEECSENYETCAGLRTYVRCRPGCYCNEGLVYNDKDKSCVPKPLCPKPS